jgi:hypothetical protein
MCYALKKSFHEKSIYLVLYVKKEKSNDKNKAFQKINFLFCFIEHTKYWLLAKLDEHTYIVEMYI